MRLVSASGEFDSNRIDKGLETWPTATQDWLGEPAAQTVAHFASTRSCHSEEHEQSFIAVQPNGSARGWLSPPAPIPPAPAGAANPLRAHLSGRSEEG